jgi:predicted ATP-dependent endonuclease of OLD family
MKLEKIRIENYKSIQSLEFEIIEINGSYTYSLLGINESGKSSFLNAISLISKNSLVHPDDYFDGSSPVKLRLFYCLTDSEIKRVHKDLAENHKFDKPIIENLDLKNIEIDYIFDSDTKLTNTVIINFPKSIFANYTLKAGELYKKTESEIDLEDLNLITFFDKNYTDYFLELVHHTIFWKSSPKYLLLDEIDLNSFSKNPKEISVPLFNCFLLAGIPEDNISTEISKLNTSANISSLQSKLSVLTTKHIKQVWSEHPISITFQINSNKISLLIEDNGVEFQPKTTGQRSDGFKQFISFLLTISADNYNKELENTILLIDEPETHLHPPAQINLLEELIKITHNHNKKNNILFFATHSNYLIDKVNLDRNFKVVKENNLTTKINKIGKKTSTYSEVNYEIFGILNNDYHNELYGFIETEDKSKLGGLKKNKKWIDSRNNNEKDVSLSEYIRHSIHHPENNLNKKFTDNELKISIQELKTIKESLI